MFWSFSTQYDPEMVLGELLQDVTGAGHNTVPSTFVIEAALGPAGGLRSRASCCWQSG